MSKIAYTLSDIDQIAKLVIDKAIHPIVLLHGDMGAGKTTLIKAIAKQLDIEDPVSSPTFSLVNEYMNIKGKKMYHFDFYRIENEEEAYNIGVEDYLDSGNWCFIEWGEKIENLLPLDVVNVFIDILDEKKRTITIESNG